MSWGTYSFKRWMKKLSEAEKMLLEDEDVKALVFKAQQDANQEGWKDAHNYDPLWDSD